MTNRISRSLMPCAIAVIAIGLGGGQALAQGEEPPAGRPTAVTPLKADGPASSRITPRSRMPLADPSQFLDTGNPASPAMAPAKDLVPGVYTGGKGGAAESQLESPMAYGSAKAPYTTARVAVQAFGWSPTANATPVTSYPYRATGRLWMRYPDGWYVCTASMISRNIALTAAHCVHNYGKKSPGYASQVWFYPAQYSNDNGSQAVPYGIFKGVRWRVLAPYYNGTDTCTQTGVVCNNDLATVVLAKNSAGNYPGDVTGWYSYGWNGYSYSSLFGASIVALSQLGYPVALDAGKDMERTDAPGWYYASGNLKNTQLGSAQTGGSSGGPWLVNFGRRPVVTDATKASLGSATVPAVVGVTSYGSTTVGYNRQGASYFGQNAEYPGSSATYHGYGAGNIGALVYYTKTLDGGL